MPTSTSNIFCRVNRRRPYQICGKPDWCSLLCGISTLFLANLSSILSQTQNRWWKTPIGILIQPFHQRLSQHRQASSRKQRRSGALSVDGAQVPHNMMVLGAGVFPASNQGGEMIINRETIRQVSLTPSPDNFVCHCEETGWIPIEGKGVKEAAPGFGRKRSASLNVFLLSMNTFALRASCRI
jgi:hypothetical protein